jgi:hypothetical protein
MAASTVLRLVSVNTRDGFDTRKKALNDACSEKQELACDDCGYGIARQCFTGYSGVVYSLCDMCGEDVFLAMSDRDALADMALDTIDEVICEDDYLLPPGAEIVGSEMNGIWQNYMTVAEAYISAPDSFLFVSYTDEQSYNEREIERITPAADELLNLHREYYNRSITEYRKTGDLDALETAMRHRAEFRDEERTQ